MPRGSQSQAAGREGGVRVLGDTVQPLCLPRLSPRHCSRGSPQCCSWQSAQVRPPKPGRQEHCPVNCKTRRGRGWHPHPHPVPPYPRPRGVSPGCRRVSGRAEGGRRRARSPARCPGSRSWGCSGRRPGPPRGAGSGTARSAGRTGTAAARRCWGRCPARCRSSLETEGGLNGDGDGDRKRTGRRLGWGRDRGTGGVGWGRMETSWMGMG